MNKLFVNILFFSIPLLLLATGVETYVRFIPNTYAYKRNWMDKNSKQVKTLILGNSHLNNAIIPSMMEGAFNLTNSSQILEYDSWLLAQYIGKCDNLKTVLISLDYHNLFACDYESWSGLEGWRPIYYNLYMGYPKHGILSPYHYELSCSRFMCSKVEDYIVSKIRGKKYDIRCDSLGKYGSLKRNPRKLKETSIKKEIRYSSLEGDILNIQKNLSYIREIVRLCNSYHVRLIFVSVPYWHLFNDNIDETRIRLFYETISNLKSSSQIEYLDFRTDRRFTNDEMMFKDSHHLSYDGAKLFTEILIRDYGIK